MNDLSPTRLAPDAYGTLSEPDTLTIQRLLPGPVERVWEYLTQSELRRQWLAAGEMALAVGAPFEFVWRNDELTSPPGARPAGSAEEHRLECSITELDPPRKLAITWGSTGGVTFTLEPIGSKTLLTVTHRRVCERPMLLSVSAGWHTHLDVLAARMAGQEPEPFWDQIARLKPEYDRRFPA
ncbi:SRPBCC family protein [Microvirga splendida]|uniref:SRPBCC family protein n=1 Tax=Microvirga splendida TaxID=2795727 RepID=A0ABS0XXL2_9HYPH|nr:SRPBCC family protein [Microvirga splendida]MBJ6124779.1 SRPBCC family protein [Microvirga splendida]